MFVNGQGAAVGVDTGDIPASLRFRSGASAYLSRTFGTPTSQTRGLISLWYKPGWLLGGLCNAVFLATANPTTSGLIIGGTGAFGATYENRLLLRNGGASKDYWNLVFRDPTSWYHIVVSFDTTQGTQADRAKCWVNGVEQTKGGSSLGASEAIGFLASGTKTINGNQASYYGDQYLARFVLMDGQCVQQSTASVSSFGYLNTEINEWVSMSQSAVKAVVDAGGTNSFMLDFDDPNFATYNVGKDYSSKGNHWTPNSFSLTAGTSYDRMLDVPGNSFATLNNIHPSAANITNGNLTSGTTAVRATMNALSFDSKWEVTAGASAVTAGVISGTGTTNTTSVTANKVFAFRLTTAGALDYKNVTDGGSWTSITTGLTGEQYPYSTTQAANYNFGQAPLHASATYQSAAGGYFYDTTTGYKALCQRNMPDVALPSGKSVSVAVRTTANSIDSSLASARSGWSGYVDIKKVADIADTWAWQFSHDSSNEYAVTASSISRAAKRSFSGSNPTVGHSIRIGSEYGTTAGSVSHVNGVGEVVTHNLGGSRWAVLVFSRIGSCQIYHSSFPAGYFASLHTTGVLSNAGGFLSSVTSNSFTINSTTSTKTLDYLVLSAVGGAISIGSYTGAGATTDNAYAQLRGKAGLLFIKRASTSVAANNVYLSAISNGNNVAETALRFNTDESEATVGTTYDTDINAFGIKSRASNVADVSAADTYAYIALLDVLQNYSLAR